MKKILLTAILLVLPMVAVADTPILLRVKGKTYYLRDKKTLDGLLSKFQKEPCLKNLFPDGLDSIWEELLKSCSVNLNKLENRLTELGGGSMFRTSAAKVSLKWDRKFGDYEEALEVCLVESGMLRDEIEKKSKNMLYVSSNVNLNECVAAVKYNSSCNIGAGSKYANTIDINKMRSVDWNKPYYGGHNFPVKGGVKKSNKALVFDGNVLIACRKDGRYSKPEHVVFTAYSGLKNGCRSKQYSGVPNSGPIPDGVYLVREKDRIVHTTSKDKKSWGSYRYPLIPAVTTKTYFRDSMYLHGTSDSSKMQSAGCISLGTNIEEFVGTGWLKGEIPVYVILSK